MLPRPLPRPGDVVKVDSRASVQFAADRGFVARVIRVDSRISYVGWVWLDVYVLDAAGIAIERRRIYVQHDGLQPATIQPPEQFRYAPRERNSRQPSARPDNRSVREKTQ